MRLIVHDQSGHPFQVQLSRALAARGHDVRHIYSASFQTPKGPLQRRAGDLATFTVQGLQLRRQFAKYSMVQRAIQEWEYARLVRKEIADFRPDAVLSGNAPPLVQNSIARQCQANGVRFTFWVQDVYGLAVRRLLGPRWPVVGNLAASVLEHLERDAMQKSRHVIVISPDFVPLLASWQIRREAIRVIVNWAPVEEFPVRQKKNPWSIRMGLESRPCVMYSGTLGLKHDIKLLADLAERLPSDTRVVVISEGLGADRLKVQKRERQLDNLMLLDFQPFVDMPDVLATADVLLAILEPDAGVYSVPSKVLTYMCAARPLVVGVPAQNQAAKSVRDNGAGVVVDPTNVPLWCRTVADLLGNESCRVRMAANARAFAEREFDIARIAAEFDEVLAS